MNKNNSVQYFLHCDDHIVKYGENKKNIFDWYRKLCEENPNKHYYICRVQTIREIIAKSEDCRQSLFSFV